MLIDADDMVGWELGADERLLWSGRPRQGLLLRASDAFMVPFSLMWGGFAIFWEAGVLRAGAPIFFAIWGVPFVLVGLYMIFGRFVTDSAERARTYYGVTSERVIIISGMFTRRVKSLALDTLTDLSLTERSDGSGTISFGTPSPWQWWYGGWPGMNMHAVPCFDAVGEARRVYDILLKARLAAKRDD